MGDQIKKINSYSLTYRCKRQTLDIPNCKQLADATIVGRGRGALQHNVAIGTRNLERETQVVGRVNTKNADVDVLSFFNMTY